MSRKNRNRRGRPADSDELDDELAGFEATQDRRGRERRGRREERNPREREADERRRSAAVTGARPVALPSAGRRSSGYAVDSPGPIPMLTQVVRACGSCRNWQPDDMPGGRGICEHPGSGFLSPYADTPACPFYDR